MLVRTSPKKFEVERYYTPGKQEGDWWEKSIAIQNLIYGWLDEHIGSRTFDLAVEEPYIPNPNRIGSFGIQNRFLGMLYTFMRYNFAANIGKVYLVHPGTLKKCMTGKGNAPKELVVKAASRMTQLPIRKPSKEAVADAIGVAYATWIYTRDNIDGVREL